MIQGKISFLQLIIFTLTLSALHTCSVRRAYEDGKASGSSSIFVSPGTNLEPQEMAPEVEQIHL